MSRVALLASVVGALLGALADWSLYEPLPGGLSAIAYGGWFLLSISGIVLGIVQLVRPRQRRRQPAVAAVLGFASLLVLVVLAVSAAGLFASNKSDNELLATFRRHESQFARAVAEFKAKGQASRSLLKQLGIEPDMVWGDTEGVVYLQASSEGLAVSGSSKGYAYSTQPLTPTADSLDNYDGAAPGGVAYRHIDGPWYLYYDWTI